MQTKDFESVKAAKLAAKAQLAFYDEMMSRKKENESLSAQYIKESVKKDMKPFYDAFTKGYTMNTGQGKKKLFIVDTITTFKHTYVIEAEELEHAYDEITMIDSGNDDDCFESAEQVYLGETIIDGRKISKKQFQKLLKKIEEEGTGSHWMGEQLIRKIDYARD